MQTEVTPIKKRFLDAFTVQSSYLVFIMMMLLMLFAALTQNWFGLDDLLSGTQIESIFLAVSGHPVMPLLIIMIPSIGAVITLLFGQRFHDRRDRVVIMMSFLTMVFTLALYPTVSVGPIDLSLPGFLGLGLSLHIDMLGYTVLLLSSVIWFLVMVYAHEYMLKEKHTTRFFVFMALTYSAVLSTLMSGDLLTMFLSFEIMTFTSYMLVIHGQKEDAYKAGYNYIIMGLIGGFMILAAMLLLYVNVGDLRFTSALSKLNEIGSTKYWIIGLLVLGFGIKAGMAPVHVWLPRAHPVAPTPASALLSGIMIKVGAFGILRVATSYYFPQTGSSTGFDDPIWLTVEQIGSVIIWFGIITMAIGVFLALQQSNMKRMLAYHSVSQMGYIIMGVGVALYLGYKGAMGYGGALYHVINHAIFKSLLFMVVGVVYYHTKEYDMYKLGGLWKKLPLTGTVCLIASLGISGVPLFNGYISKTLLHHGIVEAYTYGHPSFLFAELLFMVVSAGTACSFIKLFYYVFVRKTENTYEDVKPEYNCLDTALVAIALLIVWIGLAPRFVLDVLITPALYETGYDPYFIKNYIEGIGFFVVPDLLNALWALLGGIVLFLVGTKMHWFHLKLPKWLSVEYIFFYPAYLLMKKACLLMYGDRCPIGEDYVQKVQDDDLEKVTFLDRFVIVVDMFNRRFESSIIRSDALIYTGFITLILIVMMFFGIF